MSTLVDERTEEKVRTTDGGDHDKFSHFFKNSDVEKAVFTGKPATALCGKKDIPMGEASKYEVCPTCKGIYDRLK